jgi:hypothetical protein
VVDQRLEFHFDRLDHHHHGGCVFKGVCFNLGFCLLYHPTLEGREEEEEEEEEEEDSKEGTLSPKDPKPSLKGSTPESPLLPLNPKPSFKAQGLGRIG